MKQRWYALETKALRMGNAEVPSRRILWIEATAQRQATGQPLQ